jgi:hypothetical protein
VEGGCYPQFPNHLGSKITFISVAATWLGT